MATQIIVQVSVNAPLETAWRTWNSPEHITNWNFANDDWCCPRAEVDLRTGGSFSSRMEAKDGSFGFDFSATYDAVEPMRHIAYTMPDGRKVTIQFAETDGITRIEQTFDAETENSVELQQAGWQAIMNNYQRYTEGLA